MKYFMIKFDISSQGGMNIHKALFLPVVTLTGDDDGIIQELEKNKLC